MDEFENLKQPLNNALKEELAEREREFVDSVLKRSDEDDGSTNDKEYCSSNDKEHNFAGKGIIENECFEETRKECKEILI